jgi:transposase-like protein
MTGTRAAFVPPFCPNPACAFHTCSAGWRWKRDGFHFRHCEPRKVQRYRCRHCRRSFSDQTFRLSYWLKRPELLLPVAWGLLNCSAFRQVARASGVAPSTVAGLCARLGRHALLLHQRWRPRGPLAEPLVIDGFESFEYSQDHPLWLNLAVGAHSHFLYGFTDSELRRKGRMTAAQKRRRAQLEARLGRPDPRAVELETAALLELVAPAPQPLELRSDDHPAYRRALPRVPHLQIRHQVTPGSAPRTPGNPLFPVNLADGLLRHSSAHHKRETIAFAKCRASMLDRLALFQLWRNWVKSCSENHPGQTPAMRLGLAPRPYSLAELLAPRGFPSRIALPERLARYYWRRVRTRALPRQRSHQLRYAA